MRLIYSYSDSTDLRYHGPTKRGTKSVSLLSEVQIPETMPSDVRHIEFLNRNVRGFLAYVTKFRQPHQTKLNCLKMHSLFSALYLCQNE